MRKSALVIGAGGGVRIEVARVLSHRYEVIGTIRNAMQIDAVRALAPAVSPIVRLDLSD